MKSEKEAILSQVLSVRKLLPNLGTRKIYSLILPKLIEDKISFGRDKLFSLVKEKGLGIRPAKVFVNTTDSRHWMKKYPNLFKDKQISAPEDAFVSDITYIRTLDGFCYLTLITDAFSRKVMGFNVGDNLSADECVNALNMAVKNRIYPQKEALHHSDRGLQYCSGIYVSTAEKGIMKMSMTETSSPYDNALAERMNRIFKEEFGLNGIHKNISVVRKLVEEAVELYNNYRPHLSLNYKTPNYVHYNA